MLTVYFKRKLPAYAVRNEQGFRTPGVFSCDAFSFRGCPVISPRQAPAKRQRRAVQLHQRRLQQLCFDVRDGRKTVPETMNALGHCVRLFEQS